jgi:hypothetical protein
MHKAVGPQGLPNLQKWKQKWMRTRDWSDIDFALIVLEVRTSYGVAQFPVTLYTPPPLPFGDVPISVRGSSLLDEVVASLCFGRCVATPFTSNSKIAYENRMRTMLL